MNKKMLIGGLLGALLLLPMSGKAQLDLLGGKCWFYPEYTPCHYTFREGLWVWVECDPFWRMGCVPAQNEMCTEYLVYPIDFIDVSCTEHLDPCHEDLTGGSQFTIQIEKTWCTILP